ncbi:MAG: FeoA family protein [Alcanivorax sp.]|nr:FeoA family protein [Alcanivorax sp.]
MPDDLNRCAVLARFSLGQGRVGTRGTVLGLDVAGHDADLERLLLEIGFVEGARVEVLHQGPFGRDPIAVRVDDMRVALRRREARAIMIQPDQES